VLVERLLQRECSRRHLPGELLGDGAVLLAGLPRTALDDLYLASSRFDAAPLYLLAGHQRDVHRREHVAHAPGARAERRRRPRLVDEFDAHVVEFVDDLRPCQPRPVADADHCVIAARDLLGDHLGRLLGRHLERANDDAAPQDSDARARPRIDADDGPSVAAADVHQRFLDREPRVVCLRNHHRDVYVYGFTGGHEHVCLSRQRVAGFDGCELDVPVAQLADDLVVHLEVRRGDDDHCPELGAPGAKRLLGASDPRILCTGRANSRAVSDDTHVSTGCDPLDDLLGGGIERGTVTQVYGAPGAGKTNVALSTAVDVAAEGGTAVYIDTEGLSVERFDQVLSARTDDEDASARIVLSAVHDFEEQAEAVKDAADFAERADLIVLDSATGFYRLERDDDDHGEALRQVASQVTHLLSLARKHDLAVIITNQVFTDVESDSDRVRPLGGHTLSHWTGVVLRIDRFRGGNRRATVEKHRAQPEGGQARFQITETGIEGVEQH